jgi:hypothetical protein
MVRVSLGMDDLAVLCVGEDAAPYGTVRADGCGGFGILDA